MGDKKNITVLVNRTDYVDFVNTARDRALDSTKVLRQCIKKFIEETDDSIDFLFNR